MTIELRSTALDSTDGLRLLGAFTDEISDLYPGWTPAKGPSAHPSEFLPPTGLFVIAYQADLAIGCGGFKQLATKIAEIKRIYVRPECRGDGVARRVLEHLEQSARELGYDAVRLDTGDRQPEALALFERTGYQQVPDYNGNPFASYWFEKKL